MGAGMPTLDAATYFSVRVARMGYGSCPWQSSLIAKDMLFKRRKIDKDGVPRKFQRTIH